MFQSPLPGIFTFAFAFWILVVLSAVLPAHGTYHSDNYASRTKHFRDPDWKPCLLLCMSECGSYVGFDLKYCAENCLESGMWNFEPQKFCFDFPKVFKEFAKRKDAGNERDIE